MLLSNDFLGNLLQSKSLFTWGELVNYVKKIPYGRNTNRNDFSLVITENKGTCSSKHALLKEIANQNNIPNVVLIIGIYKMTETNTNIKNILTTNNLNYIPEAHCYLKIDGNVVDVTSTSANFENIKKDILEEIEIEPCQVIDFKIEYHKKFIRKWLNENNSKLTFEQIWMIREKCISQLSN